MQVALIVPFMRLGEVVLREKHLPLSPVSLKDIIFKHPGARTYTCQTQRCLEQAGQATHSTSLHCWACGPAVIVHLELYELQVGCCILVVRRVATHSLGP